MNNIKLLAVLILLSSNSYSQQLDVYSSSINTKESYSIYHEKYEYESKTFDCSNYGKSFAANQVFYNVENIEKTDFNSIKLLLTHYAEFFTQSSPRFNWKKEFKFFIDEIKFDFVTGDSRTIAQAHSPLKGDATIIINIDKWEKLNSLERVWLFFHEYAHEVYGLEHGEIKLMYPLLPSDKLKDDLNLDDENIVGDKLSIKHKRRNRNENLLLLSPYCKTNQLEYFYWVSKSNAYLYNAIEEFMSHISLWSDKTKLLEVQNWYPTYVESGKVAFPENKVVYAIPINYKNPPN